MELATKADLRNFERRMIIRMGGMIVIQVLATVALIKLVT